MNERALEMGGRPFRKYFSVFAISLREASSHRAAVYGRGVFLVAILLVFSALWTTVFAGREALSGLRVSDMIWYLMLTEWALMSAPFVYLDIEREIRSGDVACQLPRPISYLWAQVWDCVGKMLVRSLVLGVFGVVSAWLLVGELPSNPIGLVYALPLGLMAGLVMTLGMIAIGLLAVWLIDVQPVYFVWQKLCFVLGGLIFPLDIYPDWLVQIGKCTPFYACLYGVGRLAYQPEPAILLESAGLLVFWTLVLLALCAWIYRRGLKSLTISGG